ncbi:MAG TPA: AAA family ATPase, partial [Nitrososphaera sp.]|nr:AAA family ATPase [Nitrososphaera sp.]
KKIDLYVTKANAELDDLDPTLEGMKERQVVADRETEDAILKQQAQGVQQKPDSIPNSASAVREGKALLAQTYSQRKRNMQERAPALIPGLLARNEVGIFAADSGEGKSPLMVQMMLCVAAGVPFLDTPVQQGKVLYVDYENGDQMTKFEEDIQAALGLPELPEKNYAVIEMPENVEKLEKEIASYKPDLVIIDTLRQFAPAASSKNDIGSSDVGKLRRWARKYGCTIVFIHHLRKHGEMGVKERAVDKQLITTDVVEWMEEVEGARALVNHTYFRIGMEKYPGDHNKCEVVLKANYKGSGDGPPIYVGRVRHDDGSEKGYFRIPGASILSSDSKRVYAQLAGKFRFVDVEKLAGSARKADKAIKELAGQNLIERVGKPRAPGTHYVKKSTTGSSSRVN